MDAGDWSTPKKAGDFQNAPSTFLHSLAPMRRERKPQIFAQGLALIVPPEEAAPLQFRHHQIDKILQACGEQRGHDVEAVGGALFKPCLEIVGYVSGRAMDDAMRPRPRNPLIDLPYRQFLLPGHLDDDLLTT